ncbi:MAG: hypothetical protein JXA30_09830 [Deltaproteobacteria bacterium]|nr:hypothetical protein [Deltaproteobacteria bacterium]
MVSYVKNRVLGLALVVVLLAGCAHDYLPDTTVEDTEENRRVLQFVEEYRRAVESRDMSRLLSLTSVNYFDDMGTPVGDDDIDYETLQKELRRLRSEVLDARYQIRYQGVTYLADRALIDILYTGWFRVNTAEGPQWRRRLTPHRLVVALEAGRYKIVSGI